MIDQTQANKTPVSISIQPMLKEALNNFDMGSLTKTFNTFFTYFEEFMLSYLHNNFFCIDGKFVNSSINIDEDRLKKLKELVELKLFANTSEAIRFVYLLGIYEVYRHNNPDKENIVNIMDFYFGLNKETLETEPEENKKINLEIETILSKVISQEEYLEKREENND